MLNPNPTWAWIRQQERKERLKDKPRRKTAQQVNRDQFYNLARAYRDGMIDGHSFYNRATILGTYWSHLATWYMTGHD